jgi:protein ImuB
MRVACAAVVDLSLQAWRRAQPELCGEPLAIANGAALTARVVMLSDEARALGVRPGLTAAQARAIAPSLQVRPIDPVRDDAARGALLDVAAGIGARIEPDGDAVLLEVGDLGRLHPSERAVGQALISGARAVGLAVRVGIASSKGVARLAAWAGHGPIEVVAAGSEAAFVAPLPVSALSPSAEMALALARFGVRSCGRLAKLPATEIALRFGREGERLSHLARGRCSEPLTPRAPTVEIEEGMELDWAVADLEALGFVLRGLCDRVLARLAARHLACAGIGLRLHLESRAYDVREIGLAAPTREVATLLEIVRLAVEKRPPDAAVVGVSILARAARGSVAQLDLFRPRGVAPDRLAATVARLQALVGEDRVGKVQAVDTYRDEEISVVAFDGNGTVTKKENIRERTVGNEIGNRNVNGYESSAQRLILRRFRPPKEIEVLLDSGQLPRMITGIGTVIVATGPYRTTGEWWAGGGYRRDVWDLHASDGALYRAFRDASHRWFLEGYYD